MNKTRGYIVPVLIVIIIVLVIAFIIYAVKKENTVVVLNENNQEVQTPLATTTVTKPVVRPIVPSTPATPAPSATTTATWKTYTSPTKGYSIKYPAGFVLSSESASCVALVKDGVGYIYIGAPGTYSCTGYAPNASDVSSTKPVLANKKEFTATGYMNKDWTASYLNFLITGGLEISYGVRAKEAAKASTPQEYTARLSELESVITTITVK